MAAAEKIYINGEVLKWARESAGILPAALAERLKVTEDRLAEWEKSRATLGVTELRNLAAFLRRPVPVLLRSTPPIDGDFPTDFRTIGGRRPTMSRPVLSALKRARRLQRAIGALPLHMQPGRDLGTAGRSEDPDSVSRKERSRLGVADTDQLSFTSPNVAFNAWRGRLQSLGVMVLVQPMPRDDCRGFALWDEKLPPTVVITNDEADEAKSFSAMHEYGHLLLRESAACLELADGSGDLAATERWCNEFAGAVLAPGDALNTVMRQLGIRAPVTLLADITSIARRLRISRHVVALRLERLGMAPHGLYDRLRPSLARDGYRERRDDADIQLTSARRAASELGYLPALAVLSAVAEGEAGPLDAAGLLKIPAGRLRDLRAEVERLRAAHSGA